MLHALLLNLYHFSEKSMDIDDLCSTGSYETNESTPLLASTDSTSVTIKKRKTGFSLVKPILKHWLPLLMGVRINLLYLLYVCFLQ